ncbi:MFS general substrate transporter [Coccomyxa subellipsoidea C-169]|uniref:MFS general substrate transporter n=1 Tax=Coccomyxa subellipsoidea (strain C-169) TaxID=574566 RepID=I0YV39_COCSC|nr:MFS general substrate transporter [Coccomyxa subellipsoidea C-169]EIE22258.1 MFS general substrate transporter [Coccomyxa subellipsoidea C-169]|eukprot:XP_005646802.1 MFS general substrate transporter [Coccomyxa subellipsoidea C-169]
MNITIAYTIGVYMSSFYSLGQLTTAFAWGTLSDMYGRKRFILMSNIVSTLSMLWFGLAPSYTSAAAARLVGGLFNCSFTNVRSMIGESTDFTSQAVAFGYLGLAFGVGTVLGPLVGGALSMPCENVGPGFPLCGEGHLNAIRPFFLPCLVTALVSAVAVASNVFLMSETLPRIVEARRAKQLEQEGEAIVPLLIDDLTPGQTVPDIEGGVPPPLEEPVSIADESAPHGSIPIGRSPANADRLPRSFRPKHIATSSPDDVPFLQLGTPFLMTSTVSANVADDMAEFEADNPGRWTEERFRSSSSGFFRRVTMDAAVSSLAAADVGADVLEDFEARGGGGRHVHAPAQPPRRVAPTHVSLLSRAIPRSVFADSEEGGASSPNGAQHPELEGIAEEQAPKPADVDAAENGQGSKPADEDPEKAWYKDPLVLLSCCGYMMICFMFNMLDELFPIFAAAPIATGGLSFSSSDLSLPLSVSGAALMVWSLFIFPTVQTALGAWMCAVTGLAVTVLLSVALGCTSFLAAAGLSHTAVLTALLAVMVLKVCAQQMCFPTSMAIVNRFAPAAYRGAVNGTAQSMASAVRALGPFLGGVMWAVFSGLDVPGHQLFPFVIISVTSAATVLLYQFLPRI